MSDMDDFLWNMRDSFRHAEEGARKTEHEFERLALDPCSDIPEVGDRVIVAVGLIGHGFAWVREEATVLEIGSSSYKVQLSKQKDFDSNKPVECWIHSVLVTDVLKRKDG